MLEKYCYAIMTAKKDLSGMELYIPPKKMSLTKTVWIVLDLTFYYHNFLSTYINVYRANAASIIVKK